MANTGNFEEPLIYGLDIGTRSVVGTVGYKQKDRFVVVAQVVKEHETRAMLDGQIHDILAVGNTVLEITKELEQKLSVKLENVCIAAAGRVLKTVTASAEQEFEDNKVVTTEDILSLEALAVEHAYEKFQQENDTDMKFYCVGYSVMKYYMNNYPMGNLLDHKAKQISLELIATFLPDDVVDGLYRAVEHAGLTVANLTLEPIAAIEVAIPEMFRMLNIGLIDVGAGTSDICITKDGSIIAYGMLPIAGDGLTEIIARHCLVDFVTADSIKIGIEKNEVVEYKDIMGLPQKITREEVLALIQPQIDQMAEEAADKLLELNGGKPVSAVFVVGGGGKIAGYTNKIAERLGIPPERCAVRGEDVMQKIEFMERNVVKDSLLVTPIGICLNYYQKSNNFIFVYFNNKRVRLYDNNKLTVIDAAIQADFPNDGLFPKRGKSMNVTIDGKAKLIRGLAGEAAVITVNGSSADIHTSIRSNDVIEVTESTAGEDAVMELSKLMEFNSKITISVNEQKVEFPKYASVNGNIQTGFYEIQDGDEIEMLSYYTIRQITEFMDVTLDKNMSIYVNNQLADENTKVYDNFSVVWTLDGQKDQSEGLEELDDSEDLEDAEAYEDLQETDAEIDLEADSVEKQEDNSNEVLQEDVKTELNEKADSDEKTENVKTIKADTASAKKVDEATKTDGNRKQQTNKNKNKKKADHSKQYENTTSAMAEEKAENASNDDGTKDAGKAKDTSAGSQNTIINVYVNQRKVILSGQKDYIFVDVFDHIDFDLSKPQGSMVVLKLNGKDAAYTDILKTGDMLDIYWAK